MYRYRSGRSNLEDSWRSYRVLVDVPVLGSMRRRRRGIFWQFRACERVQTVISVYKTGQYMCRCCVVMAIAMAMLHSGGYRLPRTSV